MAQFKAIKNGYDGHKVREVGEEFPMPDGWKAKWAVPADEFVQPKPLAQPDYKTITARTLLGVQQENAVDLLGG